MAKGGARVGAGRKKGSKTKLTEEALARAGEGITPLEYMLNMLRDEALDPLQRFEAAKAAAPYVHPRLAQTEATVTHKKEADELTDAELAAYLASAGSPRVAEPEAGPAKPH